MLENAKLNNTNDLIKENFFEEHSIIKVMQRLNVTIGSPSFSLLEMISNICRGMVSKHGREFLPKYFNRNGALGLRMQTPFTPGANFILKFCELEDAEKIKDLELRMFFIYMSYCILRGHISIDTLERTSSENIPTFEQWFLSMTNIGYVYSEEDLLDELARLTRFVGKGRISRTATQGMLDQSFKQPEDSI